jgi:hypothetical protein
MSREAHSCFYCGCYSFNEIRSKPAELNANFHKYFS